MYVGETNSPGPGQLGQEAANESGNANKHHPLAGNVATGSADVDRLV